MKFTQKKKKKKSWGKKKEIENLKTEVKEDDLSNATELSAKLIKLEDGSWRDNLQIDGIKEEPSVTWKACYIEIDRCHRIGPHKTKTG